MDYYPNKKEHAAAVKAKKAVKKVKWHSTIPTRVLLEYASKPQIFRSFSSVLAKDENFPWAVTYSPKWKLVQYIVHPAVDFMPKSFRTKIVPAGRVPIQQTWLTFGRMAVPRGDKGKYALHTIEIPIQRVEGIIRKQWMSKETAGPETRSIFGRRPPIPPLEPTSPVAGIMPLADSMREYQAEIALNVPVPPPWYQTTHAAPVMPNFSRPDYQITRAAPVSPNPLLMTILPNPGEEDTTTPFKKNKPIPIGKFEAWLRKYGTRDQIKRYESAVSAYMKFHQGAKPRSVRMFSEEIGDRDSEKIEREFEYSLGKSPAEIYNVPNYSGKAPYSYVHDYETLPEVSSPAGGQRIVKRFQGTKTHVSDWIHG